MKGIWRRQGDRRRWLIEAIVGVAMLPLTALPIWLYLTRTDAGYLMYLKGRYQLFRPATPQLDAPGHSAVVSIRRLRVHGVPVLVYHGIGRAGATDSTDARFTLTRTRFAQQMRALELAGFTGITTTQLADYLSSGDDSLLPRRPILITFDDGRADAMIQADPILRDTGLRATMFVIGHAADSASFYYVNRSGLRSYAGDGRWELGAHTFDLHSLHERGSAERPISSLADRGLSESMAEYEARIDADLDRGDRLIKRLTGRPPAGFAYPYGDWGETARAGVAASLRSVLGARYRVGFDQDGQSGWRFALPGDDPLHIHRLEVMNWTGAELISRLAAAARLTRTTYEERGLNIRISASELAAAFARSSCPRIAHAPVRSRPGVGRVVAIGFDDGPSPYTPQILDVLDRYGAHATFFEIGEQIRGHERLLERIVLSGNEIANHTWDHPHAARLDSRALDREVVLTTRAIHAALPLRPCFLRPPYGEDATRWQRVAARHGLGTVLWSVDPRDYALTSPPKIARRVLAGIEAGAIVVMHDGGGARWPTVQALPRILSELHRRGYRVVTISQLLKAKPLQSSS